MKAKRCILNFTKLSRSLDSHTYGHIKFSPLPIEFYIGQTLLIMTDTWMSKYSTMPSSLRLWLSLCQLWFLGRRYCSSLWLTIPLLFKKMFFNVYLVLRESGGEGQRERGRHRIWKSPSSVLSSQIPTWGLNSGTARSWPRLMSDA